MSPKKKKPKKPARPRNPFAGQSRSGAGFHSEKKYGKKDRREGMQELEESADEPASGELEQPEDD
jgi:hypothetical protein